MTGTVEIDEGVERLSLKEYTEKAYLDYSMYVILGPSTAQYRRWPKTGATTHRLRYVPSWGCGREPKFKKSARTVGGRAG